MFQKKDFIFDEILEQTKIVSMALLIEKKEIPQIIGRFERYLHEGYSPEAVSKLMDNEELVLVALFYYKLKTEIELQNADLVQYEEVVVI
jgi:hypothetical protein